jgi:hypothetical protein
LVNISLGVSKRKGQKLTHCSSKAKSFQIMAENNSRCWNDPALPGVRIDKTFCLCAGDERSGRQWCAQWLLKFTASVHHINSISQQRVHLGKKLSYQYDLPCHFTISLCFQLKDYSINKINKQLLAKFNYMNGWASHSCCSQRSKENTASQFLCNWSHLTPVGAGDETQLWTKI